MLSIFRKLCLTAIALALVSVCDFSAPRAEEDKAAPCRDDAMIVFDASGSMSGNQTLGIPNSETRIDEVRSALEEVLPSVTRLRRVGADQFRSRSLEPVQRSAQSQADG